MVQTQRPVKAIIFAGGVGTRMWPMSRKGFPKQFQELIGNESMFQAMVERVLAGFAPEDVYISTGEEYLDFVRKQAPRIPTENFIAEPIRRDTLGAVGLANLVVHQRFPDALVAAIWGADHVVKDLKEFNRALKTAAAYSAQTNKLVKIDVRPTFPSIHNGWVKIGKKIDSKNDFNIHKFVKFIEKPNEEKAKRLFSSRQYLINTGYLVWPAQLMTDFFRDYQPKAYEILEKIRPSLGKSEEKITVAKLYPEFEKISIDYGIFEKLTSENTAVIPVDIGWTDVGTWELLYEGIASNPRKDNLVKGNVKFLDSKRSIVYSNVPDKVIGIIGLDSIIVIDTKDGLVVCAMHESDKVKKLVDVLKEDSSTIKYT